jgi:hypothetical protein
MWLRRTKHRLKTTIFLRTGKKKKRNCNFSGFSIGFSYIFIVLAPIFRFSGPSPFKGEVRRGMRFFGAQKPIPIPTLPLKGREIRGMAEDQL